MNTPNLYAVLSAAIESTSYAGKHEAIVDGATNELAQLQATIKAQREQQERTNRAMVNYAKRDKELVDKLCDIRDMLKPHMVSYSTWASPPEAAIRTILAKHFSVDIPE